MISNHDILKKRLAGKMIGDPLYYYEQIDSTNDEAFRLGTGGAPEGAVLIAESQSAGKGRMQRVWHSPAGANIYTSVILRPKFVVTRAPQISIAAGVAVAETLNRYCPDRVRIKWPNDVLIGDKKICGILAQMKMTTGCIDFVVVGIGINVNMNAEQFPLEIQTIATSLAVEAGCEISRMELIIRLYENLSKWYKKLIVSGFDPVRKAWTDMTPMIGRAVEVMFQGEVVSGRAIGLDDDGSLLLLTEGNRKLNIAAGDATIIKR